MSRDSNGNYTLPPGYQAVTGEPIIASQHNPPLEDIAQAMTGSVSRQGSGGMLADLAMGGYKITGGANGVASTDFVTKAQLDVVVASIAILSVPSGTIVYFAGSSTPSGWLACYGQAVSRVGYSALFTAIATSYGAGDGSTTFNVPDDRGLFLRGLDSGRGIDPGRIFGSIQSDAFRSHIHAAENGVNDPGHLHPNAFGAQYNSNGSGPGFSTPSESGTSARNWSTGPSTTGISVTTAVLASGGPETRPWNRAYLPIIKA